MSCIANQIITQVKSWNGKNEKDGSFKEIIDIYNEQKNLPRGYKLKYTDSWCMGTLSAAAIKCKATDIIPIECSCGRFIELAKEKGIWIEDDSITPLPGDFIVYDWDDDGNPSENKGWPEHIGLVVEIKNGIITVIEGNKNNAVGYREIKVNAKFIRGFARPKYDKEKTPAPEKTKNYLSEGDSGKDVETMQSMLIYCGYSCGKHGADGEFGNDTGDGLEEFQKAYNLKTDRKYGPISKAKLTEIYNAKKNNKASYYKKYSGSSSKIDVVFKAIGAPYGSVSKRKSVAKKNGYTNYSGTAKQNLDLIALAKKGKLKK